MVMEACPSPQSVGREFVRQYYTLLNNAPAHLHRFYNNQSSFVHGGLDAPNRESLPVIGQKQIHNRIEQLNFHDCHAKISQVDSQATLGNGVVVQVTGELSNGGAPMRRFTQTFVLGAQAPKKYYVHNDIFRYQDIVFTEEEGSTDNGSEHEQQEEEARALFQNYSNNNYTLNGHPPTTQSNEPTHAIASAFQAPAPVVEPEPIEEPEPAPLPLSPTPQQQPPPQPQPATPVAAAPPEPKTYANLLKCGQPGRSSNSQPPPLINNNNNNMQKQVVGDGSPPERSRPQRPGPNNGNDRRYGDRADRTDRSDKADRLDRADRADRADRGSPVQLFLGRLPVGASEEGLREVFARFGAVSEVRVTARAGGGAGGGGAYGVVGMASARAAGRALRAELYYPREDAADRVRLHVEERRPRPARRPAFVQRPHFRR